MSFSFPDSRFLAPELLIPGRKPYGPVKSTKLFTDGGLSTIKSGVVLFNPTPDLANQGRRIAPSTIEAPVSNGAIQFDGGTDILQWETSPNRVRIPSAQSQTLIVIATLNGYGGGGFGRIFESSDNEPTLWFIRNSSPYLRLRANLTNNDFNTFVPEFGTKYVFVYRSDATNVEGTIGRAGGSVIDEVSGSASVRFSSGALTFGNSAALDRGWDGSMECIINDHRYWSDTEVDQFIKNPYQFLVPDL